MTASADATTPSTASALPGTAVIAGIRRLLYAAIVAGVLYSTFLAASKGGCPGGVTESGGFIDANGDPVAVAPTCVSLALRPSPLILIALAGIVLWALNRVIRRARDEASALQILDRARWAVIVVAAVSFVVSQVWFALIPLYGIDGSGTYVWPFPFGSVEFETSPMTPEG